MTGDAGWDPERLGRLTLDQLTCLMQEKSPDSSPVLESFADVEAALEAMNKEDRAWYE